MAERPNPHSIAVCTLIALQSDPASPCLRGTSSRDTEAHLSNLLQRLVLSSDQAGGLLEGTSLTELLRLVTGDEERFGIAGDALLQDLMHSCVSVDALEDLFAALEASVAKRIDGNSVHGIYVRKHCLGFNLLPFESVVRLWTALREYVDQHSISLKGSFPLTPHSPQWPLSEAQILMYLVAQCRSIQLRGDTLPFEVIEHLLQQILFTYPELIAAHFLRYLNCYFHDEKAAALDHLHRYFDYAMIVERKERLVNGAASTTLPNSRNIVQYAPILLGTLFHRFGHFSLARKATEEALRIAQQTGDGACMAYALSWLHATNNVTYSNSTSRQLSDPSLRQASQRAIQLPLQPLFVGTCLQQAQDLLEHGAQPRIQNHVRDSSNLKAPVDFSVFFSSQTLRIVPALAWDHLAAATVFESPLGQDSALPHTSSHHSTSSTAFLADMPCHLLNIEGSRNVYETLIQQRFMSASLWTTLGNFPLSHLHARLGLDSYHDIVSTDQASDAALQSISRVRYGPGFPFSFSSIMADNNQFSGDKISDAMALYCRCFIQSEWSIYQGDWLTAKSCQRILHSSTPTLYKYGIEYLIDTLGSTAILSIRQKQYDRAKVLLDKVCQYCEQYLFHSRHAYYLLHKSIMYISIHDPMGALPSILSCLSLSDSKLLDSMHAAALSLLAQIFYEMDNLERCQSTLKAVLPRLVQYGMIWFVGESWFTLAKCCLAEKDSDLSAGHDADVRMALSHLCQAEESFQAMDDAMRLREIYYLKSHVYHQLGNYVSRNVEAQKFHEIKQRMDSCHYPK